MTLAPGYIISAMVKLETNGAARLPSASRRKLFSSALNMHGTFHQLTGRVGQTAAIRNSKDL